MTTFICSLLAAACGTCAEMPREVTVTADAKTLTHLGNALPNELPRKYAEADRILMI